MFLTFNKITTSRASGTSRMIVSADSILAVTTDQGHTTVEVSAATRFAVSQTVDQVLSYLNVVDVTAGAGVGSQCSVSGVLDFVYPTARFPHLKALMIHNSNLDETETISFNPNFVITAEEVLFNNERVAGQSTGLMVLLRDTTPRRMLLKLSFDDLVAVLGPTEVV